ncbi:MAG TPA: hypothetical protein VF143_04330 [Candidatus Nanopelagicales bacterium]
MADDEQLRRLARSSPWRWRTVRFTYEDGELPTVRAWIRRPQAMRVETQAGALLSAEPGAARPTNVSFFAVGQGGGADDAPVLPVPVWWTDPGAPEPPLGPDGLVAEPVALPLQVQLDDPMWQSYRWVALLNPRELADAEDGSAAVAIDELEEVRWHERPALRAIVRPLAGYAPRCGCCPLLPSRIAALAEGFPDPDGAFADAHEVVLDLATSICVRARELGGPHDRRGFDVVLEAVDEPMDDALFAPTRGMGRGRQRWLRGWAPQPGLAPPWA